MLCNSRTIMKLIEIGSQSVNTFMLDSPNRLKKIIYIFMHFFCTNMDFCV